MIKYIISLAAALCVVPAFAQVKPKHLIKWHMAHFPVRYFKETADAFRKEVVAKSNGEIDVEISILDVNPTDRKEFFDNAIGRVHAGEITMAQVYTHDLALQKPAFYLFSLPFLFENHAHVAAVMESPEAGGQLLASLNDVGLKGLAFTYSGGHMAVMTKDKEIRKLEDFKDLQYRRLDNPVWIEALNILGTQHFPQNLRRHGRRLSLNHSFQQGISEAADGTYADADLLMPVDSKERPLAKVLNETNYSYLTTALIINKKFFDNLPANYRTIVEQAANNAARFERQIVIGEEETIRKKIAAKYKIVKMSPGETQRLRKALEPVAQKFEPVIGRKLIEVARSLKAKDSKLAKQE